MGLGVGGTGPHAQPDGNDLDWSNWVGELAEGLGGKGRS